MNNNLKYMIIGLLIGLIFLGGYLVFDKKDNKDITNNQNNEQKVTSNNQVTQILSSKIGRFIIDKEGFVYYHKTVDKYVGAIVDFNNVSFAKFSTYKVSGYKIAIDDDQELGSEFKGYKLDLENINSAYEIETGNGGTSEVIFFLSKDGKVNELRFSSNGSKLDITLEKNTSNHPNIVSVLKSSGFGAQTYILVDKDGNKY